MISLKKFTKLFYKNKIVAKDKEQETRRSIVKQKSEEEQFKKIKKI